MFSETETTQTNFKTRLFLCGLLFASVAVFAQDAKTELMKTVKQGVGKEYPRWSDNPVAPEWRIPDFCRRNRNLRF